MTLRRRLIEMCITRGLTPTQTTNALAEIEKSGTVPAMNGRWDEEIHGMPPDIIYLWISVRRLGLKWPDDGLALDWYLPPKEKQTEMRPARNWETHSEMLERLAKITDPDSVTGGLIDFDRKAVRAVMEQRQTLLDSIDEIERGLRVELNFCAPGSPAESRLHGLLRSVRSAVAKAEGRQHG